MAAAAGLSRAHFSREFRREFGESPHAYLLTRRLERAAALLRTTDRSVADICLAVGPRERRVVHDELHAHLRHVADRVPRGVPAGRRRARIPACVVRVYGRPQHRTFREDSARAGLACGDHVSHPTQGASMIRIANAQLWVHDQDEALAFYTEKLGMEVRVDVTLPEMGDFRWLTVGPPGQRSRSC